MRFAIFLVLWKDNGVIFEKEYEVVPTNGDMVDLAVEYNPDYMTIEHRYMYEPPAEVVEVVTDSEISND